MAEHADRIFSVGRIQVGSGGDGQFRRIGWIAVASGQWVKREIVVSHHFHHRLHVFNVRLISLEYQRSRRILIREYVAIFNESVIRARNVVNIRIRSK